MTTEQVDLVLRALAGVRDDLGEVKADLAEVKAEVKATNGRVRTLELWRAGLDAIRKANSWMRPALVGLATGSALTLLAYTLNR